MLKITCRNTPYQQNKYWSLWVGFYISLVSTSDMKVTLCLILQSFTFWVDNKNYTKFTRPWYARRLPFPLNYFIPGRISRQTRWQISDGIYSEETDDILENKVCLWMIQELFFVLRWLPTVLFYEHPPFRARVRKGNFVNFSKFSLWRFTSMGTIKIRLIFWLSIFGNWPLSSIDRQIYSSFWPKLLNIYTFFGDFFKLCHIM